ncbi:hypothetical protein HKX48_004848 [Thoreauomyces humboldtii]|nr:hypothetical protein HKX48_004848 [Thoreauomyces humboldtii]
MTSQPLTSIVILGGSGRLGSKLALLALADPHFTKVSVLSRESTEPSPARDAVLTALRAAGVHVSVLSYDTTALVAAMRGHDVAVTFAWAGEEGDAIATAAAAAGVRRYVPNAWGVDYVANADVPWLTGRDDARLHVLKTGMSYTEIILGCFYETVDEDGAPSMLVNVGKDGEEEGRCTVYESGSAPVSWTAIEDGARFLLAALKQPDRTHNVTLRVEGERLSMDELVRLLEEISGKPIVKTVVSMPASVYETFEGGSPFLLMAARGTAISAPSGQPMHNDWFPDVHCLPFKKFIKQALKA